MVKGCEPHFIQRVVMTLPIDALLKPWIHAEGFGRA